MIHCRAIASEGSLVDRLVTSRTAASNHYHSVDHTMRVTREYSFIESVGISRKKSVYPLSIDNLCPSFCISHLGGKALHHITYNLHDCYISHVKEFQRPTDVSRVQRVEK